MKKLVAMLLVCVMLVSLAACGNSGSTSQNNTQSSTEARRSLQNIKN